MVVRIPQVKRTTPPDPQSDTKTTSVFETLYTVPLYSGEGFIVRMIMETNIMSVARTEHFQHQFVRLNTFHGKCWCCSTAGSMIGLTMRTTCIVVNRMLQICKRRARHWAVGVNDNV